MYSLLGLPEIQREEIIASRLEEYQKFVDRQQLAALYTKTTGGDALHSDGGEDEEDAEGEQDMELDMDIDEDSEEELGRGATREYPLALRRIHRALNMVVLGAKTKSEPKSKALDKLAEKRRARTDRANNRVSLGYLKVTHNFTKSSGVVTLGFRPKTSQKIR
jgi:hypothetical protein